MSKHTRMVAFAIMNAIAVAALLIASTVAFAQTTAAPGSGGTTNGRTPPFQALYTTTLEASFDWGDLGPDWQTQLGIVGDETLWFQWKAKAPSATKGRWEISDNNGNLLAQGEVAAAQTPGTFRFFTLDFSALGVSPPLKMRIQPLTSTGSNAGLISGPVIFTKATTSTTCFTDGGLGLPIDERLETIRNAHGLPALGGAVVTKYGMEAFDAVGVRKIEFNPDVVTKFDKWHLGSDAKAMTAMLVGILRQQYPSMVDWDTTLGDVFPEWVSTIDPTMAQTTFRRLLAHRSGIYLIDEAQGAKLVEPDVSVTQQRRNFTYAVAQYPNVILPGVLWSYQNGNYVIAAAMLEKLFQQSWEDLITQYLFDPLGMTSAGFGAPALGGDAQPWGHYYDNGMFVPSNGDNAPSLGPAGTVHMSLTDWGRFVRLYLSGHEGGVSLTGATLTELTTPYTSSDPLFGVFDDVTYGWGWGIFGTGADKLLGHGGSNGMWAAVANVYPNKDYAILAVANASAPEEVDPNPVNLAMNDTMTMLEKYHSACPGNSGRFNIRFPRGGIRK
jgi:CubicO group peptidase (beta-lactamase class C family)